MKFIRWQTIWELPRLLSPSPPDSSQHLSRILALERDIILPIKVLVLGLLYYYLFHGIPGANITASRLRDLEMLQRWFVTLEYVQSFYVAYALMNGLVGAALLAARYVPLKLLQWIVFTMGILDGLFLSALTLITGGFDSILFWVFLGLIIRNAISIPLAIQQIVMNLLICFAYVMGGVIDAAISRLPVDNVDAGSVLMLDDGRQEIEAEPFLLRIFLLVLMTACCYGLQVLVERQRRAAEEAGEFAVRQEQLRAAGRLAAEIAHQIKNPLAIINNAAYTLQRSLRESNPGAIKQVDIIREEVDRSDRIVTELMGYARLAEGRVERLSITEELDRALEQVFPADAGYEVQIVRRYAGDLPVLLMQRGQLSEILVNLMLNAREAMPRPGRLEVTATRGEGDSVQVAIEDNGPGIPADRREQIFEAYYSTKERGTGLGLAIVKHNTELSGGRVRVESELGKGARFVLHFPAKTLLNRT